MKLIKIDEFQIDNVLSRTYEISTYMWRNPNAYETFSRMFNTNNICLTKVKGGVPRVQVVTEV